MTERILKKATADTRDETRASELHRFAGNPHSVANVNAPQGPRTGNEGAHQAKRGNFLDAKAEREPSAAAVMNSFSQREEELDRNGGEHEFPGEGGIDSNSQIKRFAARKNKYKD